MSILDRFAIFFAFDDVGVRLEDADHLFPSWYRFGLKNAPFGLFQSLLRLGDGLLCHLHQLLVSLLSRFLGRLGAFFQGLANLAGGPTRLISEILESGLTSLPRFAKEL